MKKITLLAALLLLWTGEMRAQCTGYSITSTAVNVLSPTEAAAQDYVTVTLSAQATSDQNGQSPMSGAIPSHNLTIVPSTGVRLAWSSNNAVSVHAYLKIGNNPEQDEGAYPLTGTGHWFMGSGDVGLVYKMRLVATDANGNTTQDRIAVGIEAGNGPDVVFQDGIHLNAYYQLVSQFGGGSMMNNCGECQGGETQPCLQATHTPSFDSTITNPATGETHTLSNVSAGNVAKATESVSGTAYTTPVSFLPGDSPTGSTTNKIYCTMFGWIMAQEWNPGIPETEFAITAVEVIPSTCALTLRFFEEMGDGWGVQCKVAWKKPPATADRCSTASQVPDFNPDTVWDEQSCATPGNCGTADLPPPNGPNTGFPKYYFAGARGIRFGGPPAPGAPDPIINGGAHDWIFPWYVAQGYIPGGPNAAWWSIFLNIAIPKGTGLPIDCKNKDKGTSPIPVPF